MPSCPFDPLPAIGSPKSDGPDRWRDCPGPSGPPTRPSLTVGSWRASHGPGANLLHGRARHPQTREVPAQPASQRQPASHQPWFFFSSSTAALSSSRVALAKVYKLVPVRIAHPSQSITSRAPSLIETTMPCSSATLESDPESQRPPPHDAAGLGSISPPSSVRERSNMSSEVRKKFINYPVPLAG